MVIGFSVCLAELLHIYTKIGFLAMVEFIISPPTWTILWKANPMAVLSLFILNRFIYLHHFMGLAHIQASCFIERLRILAISVIITL